MTEKLSDNVGKKIVEALKMQNAPIEKEPIHVEEDIEETIEQDIDTEEDTVQDFNEEELTPNQEFVSEDAPEQNVTLDIGSILNNNSQPNELDTIFQNKINQNLGATMDFSDTQSNFEYPNNVAILNHLISKLPAGVSKQTGALIIRQTMEALGIPMKSVIREAQQVQETLTNNARECQKNIIDCKKQIANLEIKGQQYQKQAVAMNDIINLFLNTGV